MSQGNPNSPILRNILILFVLAAVVLGVLWFWLQSNEAAAPAPASPAVPSTEWTTAPEGGIPVQLPETPMTNVPVENLGPEADEPDQQETN